MGRVAVLGSLNVDVVTLVERHPVPGETVLGEAGGRFAGGKGGNQAAAAARAGRATCRCSRAWVRRGGRRLRRAPRGPGHRPVVRLPSPTAPTGTALITVDEQGENSIIVIAGANGEPDPSLAHEAGRLGSRRRAALLARGRPRTVAAAARAAHSAGARVVVNLAPYAALPPDVIELADPVVVNEAEMRALADSALVPQSLLVTFGAAGARWGMDGVDGIPSQPRRWATRSGPGTRSAVRSPRRSRVARTDGPRSRRPMPQARRRCAGSGLSRTLPSEPSSYLACYVTTGLR